MTKTIHPFPARMAPELALASLQKLQPGSIILDPMAGSGTVLRQATDLGLKAIGFDVDPLSVLMAGVWTTPIDLEKLDALFDEILRQISTLDGNLVTLPWIDDDVETSNFVGYWFGDSQRATLRSLAFVLYNLDASADAKQKRTAEANVLRVSLSRIIVTKEMCASLARDTSHSRPHRVALESNYDVLEGFERSFRALRKRISESPARGAARIDLGDARKLTAIDDSSIDAILTSPPYLNAIDYLRGHRLALVWLGWRCSEIRAIRTDSIGTERGLKTAPSTKAFIDTKTACGDVAALPPSYNRMIDRYVMDLVKMTREASRVMRRGAVATFVVGNSCLRGVFISNANSVAAAATHASLEETSRYERELPQRSRYLPLSDGALSKRMRTETILTFVKR